MGSDESDTEVLTQLTTTPAFKSVPAQFIDTPERKNSLKQALKDSAVSPSTSSSRNIVLSKCSTELFPTPNTSARAPIHPVPSSARDTNSDSPPFQMQCPICLLDFSQSSTQELQSHAESCQDFYSHSDVKWLVQKESV